MGDKSIDQLEIVVAADATEASQYNKLLMYMTYLGLHVGDFLDTPDDNVSLALLLQRWMQNIRPEALGTNQIRIPFTNERPPSMVLDMHLIQSEADIDSAVISGSSGTKFIMAIRSGSTFTISIRTSSVEGDDERLLGCFSWSGTAIVGGTIVGYELEGIGGVQAADPQIIKAWANITAGGSLADGFNIDAVSKLGTGDYQVTFTTPFASTVYQCVGGSNDGGYLIFFTITSASIVRQRVGTTSGGASDQQSSAIYIGDI